MMSQLRFVGQEQCAGRHKQCCSECLALTRLQCSLVNPFRFLGLKRGAQEPKTLDFAFYAYHRKMLK